MRTLVCAIAKLENLYIREWVEWYKSLGVTNIVIYDNNEPDGERFEDVIGDYINDGYVIIRDCRGKRDYHQYSYQLCYDEFSNDYDWIGYFDIDEFLEIDKKYANISEFLSEEFFKDADIIRVSWKHFDDNDLVRVENDDYSVRKRFTREANTSYNENSWTKGIIRGRLGRIHFSDKRDGAHLTNIPEIKKAVNCKGVEVKNATYNNGRCWENAWLCHYRFRTIEEYVTLKRKRGWSVKGYDKKFTDNLFNIDKFFKINKKTDEKIDIFNKLIKEQ